MYRGKQSMNAQHTQFFDASNKCIPSGPVRVVKKPEGIVSKVQAITEIFGYVAFCEFRISGRQNSGTKDSQISKITRFSNKNLGWESRIISVTC